MSLDPRYMIAPSLEEYFVDKTTGLPLANGIVTFYSDINRTVLKPIYTISGSPPNYTYTQLPNPSILSAVGTFQDSLGNNVLPYYFPYDEDGNVELYYITVEDQNNVPQFTREAYPNIATSASPEEGLTVTNYVPNGQFLSHFNIPEDDIANIPFGQVRAPITEIASGGWTFERPNSSTAIDNVTFFRYGTYVEPPTGPSASPRYAAEVKCTSPNPADQFKYLKLQFRDVNKFTTPSNLTSQDYTFSFNAVSEGADFQVTLYLIKFFGTGGAPSPTTTSLLTTFTITGSPTQFNFSFNFGNNIGKGIGTNNDDYVALALGLPTAQAFDGIFTDFVLTPGNVTITQFPETTDADFLSRSVTGWMPTPNPDGSDLYLPLVLTKRGMTFDHSQIGKVYASASPTLDIGELACDGAMYETAGYSSDGIPYRRLYNKIADPISGVGMFGSGPGFVTITQIQNNSKLLMTTNQLGTQTITSDGANPTGFTFTTPSVGSATRGFTAYFYDPQKLWVKCNDIGVCAAPAASNAPVTVNILRKGEDAPSDPFQDEGYLKGIRQIVQIDVASIPTASQFFHITNPTSDQYVWFKVDGVGTNPGSSGIEVDILSTMDIQTVTFCIGCALNSWQTSTIYTVAGSSIPANSYFNFYANSVHYYVWFSLNGTGIDPSIPNAIGIEAVYNSSENATQIGQTVLDVINSKYYAVPDLRGVFIRGADPASINDPDANLRFSLSTAQALFHSIGSLQFDEILSHLHDTDYGATSGSETQIVVNNNVGDGSIKTAPVNYNGGDESRPINMALNYVIKY